MADSQHANFDFQFVVPEDHILADAHRFAPSTDQDERDVAKALLDTTAITVQTKAALESATKGDTNCDLAPYFDHWIGDALDAAQRLAKSQNKELRHVAECLIEQSRAIIHSKEAFLKEAKRLQPKRP